MDAYASGSRVTSPGARATRWSIRTRRVGRLNVALVVERTGYRGRATDAMIRGSVHLNCRHGEHGASGDTKQSRFQQAKQNLYQENHLHTSISNPKATHITDREPRSIWEERNANKLPVATIADRDTDTIRAPAYRLPNLAQRRSICNSPPSAFCTTKALIELWQWHTRSRPCCESIKASFQPIFTDLL